jgi:hypothetical protein
MYRCSILYSTADQTADGGLAMYREAMFAAMWEQQRCRSNMAIKATVRLHAGTIVSQNIPEASGRVPNTGGYLRRTDEQYATSTALQLHGIQ